MVNSDLPDLSWRIGVEIELLAPRGLSRQDLAEAIARSSSGSVRRYFHPQSELSKVPGAPVLIISHWGLRQSMLRGSGLLNVLTI